MANEKLNIDIIAKDKSKQTFDKLRDKISKVRSSVFNLRNAFVGLGAGVVIKSIVDAGIQVENLGVQLKALFGSAAEGQKALDIVTKFAATTPFELSNIQQGITALATVRKQAKDAGVDFQELLQITGNTATVLGGDFALAALQVQRSFSAGIASAELFRERGVTAMAGFSQGVRTSVRDSIVGLKKAFGTGGEFGNLIQELSKTLSGTVSNLKDTFFRFQVAITRGFFFELKEQLSDLKEFTEKNDTALQNLGVNIGTHAADAIIRFSKAVRELSDSFRELQSVLGILMVVFGRILTMIAGGFLIIDDFKRRLKALGAEFETTSVRIREFRHELSDSFGEVKKEIEVVLVPIREFEHELSVRVPSATEKVISKFKELNNNAIKNLQKNFNNIHTTIAEGISSGITKVSEGLSRSIILGENLSDTFKKVAQELAVRVLSALIDMGIRLAINLALENKQITALLTKLGIEKLITREKRSQAAATASSSGGSTLSSILSLGNMFFDKGGAVRKGQPVVVGERGAELFIPNQTGQITQSARGLGSSPVNVNFSINTMDARGFEEMLEFSFPDLCLIINQAVNERGSKNLV